MPDQTNTAPVAPPAAGRMLKSILAAAREILSRNGQAPSGSPHHMGDELEELFRRMDGIHEGLIASGTGPAQEPPAAPQPPAGQT